MAEGASASGTADAGELLYVSSMLLSHLPLTPPVEDSCIIIHILEVGTPCTET